MIRGLICIIIIIVSGILFFSFWHPPPERGCTSSMWESYKGILPPLGYMIFAIFLWGIIIDDFGLLKEKDKKHGNG